MSQLTFLSSLVKISKDIANSFSKSIKESKCVIKCDHKLFCYVLKNNYLPHKNRTYNGFTNKPCRRIRQHNQEIKGGAKYTRNFGNKSWQYIALVTGFPNKINALQCEWRIKHPDNKRRRSNKYNSPKGRIKGLVEVLKLRKWTSNSIIDNDKFKLTLWLHKDYQELVKNISNIEINFFEKTDSDFLKNIT